MFSCLSSLWDLCVHHLISLRGLPQITNLRYAWQKGKKPQHGRTNFSFYEKQSNSMVDAQISEAGGQKENFLKPWNDVWKEALQKHTNIVMEMFYGMYNKKRAAMWKYSIACGFITITKEATAERHVKFGMEIDHIHCCTTQRKYFCKPRNKNSATMQNSENVSIKL